jgi:hypothetical protein
MESGPDINPRDVAVKDFIMPPRHEDLVLLDNAVVRRLLQSTAPARLAYTGPDGVRCEGLAHFEWNGIALVFRLSPELARLQAVRDGAKVTVTIDACELPCNALMIRGSARIDTERGPAPGSGQAVPAKRIEEVGGMWLPDMEPSIRRVARIVVIPQWVGLLEFRPCT